MNNLTPMKNCPGGGVGSREPKLDAGVYPPTSQYFDISLLRAERYTLLYGAVFPGLHFLNMISAYAYLIVKIVINDAQIS